MDDADARWTSARERSRPRRHGPPGRGEGDHCRRTDITPPTVALAAVLYYSIDEPLTGRILGKPLKDSKDQGQRRAARVMRANLRGRTQEAQGAPGKGSDGLIAHDLCAILMNEVVSTAPGG